MTMTANKPAAWVCFGAAAFLMLTNLGDLVSDFQNWEYAATPQFIGDMMKQIGSVGFAALGGKLLPTASEPPSKE